MIRYNAKAEDKAPNPANINKAGWMGTTSNSLSFFRYGPRPVTEWAGTAPDVVIAMARHARDFQEREHRSMCVIS